MTIIIDGTVGANKAVVLDSSGKLPAIDGSLVTTLNATQVTTGSIATARIDTGTTTGKVLVLDGSGNMPVIAAGAMTGVESATKSASDPAPSTNPATGLGTKWINTTSGEIFVCTDATAGSNVWTSSGGKSGNVQPYSYPGTSYGYTMGGYTPGPGFINVIERISFTTDGNATDVGDMAATMGTYGIHAAAGAASATYGYTLGGQTPQYDTKEKFQMVASADSVDVGNLVQGGCEHKACHTQDYAVSFAGHKNTGTKFDMLEKTLFASDATSDSGYDLRLTCAEGGSNSSLTHGYRTQGLTYGRAIDKFSFALNADSTNVADCPTSRTRNANSSSETHGYSAGGNVSVTIEKFLFATETTSGDVGDLNLAVDYNSACSSATNGYMMRGGVAYAGGHQSTNMIQKWSHVTDANSTDIGDMTVSRGSNNANIHY